MNMLARSRAENLQSTCPTHRELVPQPQYTHVLPGNLWGHLAHRVHGHGELVGEVFLLSSLTNVPHAHLILVRRLSPRSSLPRSGHTTPGAPPSLAPATLTRSIQRQHQWYCECRHHPLPSVFWPEAAIQGVSQPQPQPTANRSALILFPAMLPPTSPPPMS